MFMTFIVIMIMSTFTTVCAWVLRYLIYAVRNSFSGTDTMALFNQTAEKRSNHHGVLLSHPTVLLLRGI